MHGVAGQKNATVRVAVSDRAAPLPDAGAEPFDCEWETECAPQIGLAVGCLRCQAGTGVEHHEPPHGVDGIDRPDVGPGAVTVDGDEERCRLAPAGLQQVRSAEVEMHRMAERLAVERDAERPAHQAVGAIAADKISSGDLLASACCKIGHVGAHAVCGFLKSFKPCLTAESHMSKSTGEVLQDRVEPHLRTHLQPHRAMRTVCLALARRARHAAKLVSGKAGYEGNIERIVRRERAGVHGVSDSPAPAELHGANVHLVHLRGDDRAVALLDEHTGNAAPAELARKGEAHRSAPDDQNASVMHAPAPFWRIGPYSGLMPANFTTLPHFVVSSAMNFAKSAGEPTNGAAPRSARRPFTFGSARPALISWFSLSTILAGVFLGAPTPNQVVAS